LVVIVAPSIGLPLRFHVYVKDPKPSSSANVVIASNVCFGVVGPRSVALPVGLSLTFATALVAALVALSVKPR